MSRSPTLQILTGSAWAAVFMLAQSCGGPDNVGACEAAEAKIIEAFETCEVDRADEASLGCEQYARTSYDCTDYFNGAEQSAACGDDGEVTWTYGERCF